MARIRRCTVDSLMCSVRAIATSDAPRTRRSNTARSSAVKLHRSRKNSISDSVNSPFNFALINRTPHQCRSKCGDRTGEQTVLPLQLTDDFRCQRFHMCQDTPQNVIRAASCRFPAEATALRPSMSRTVLPPPSPSSTVAQPVCRATCISSSHVAVMPRAVVWNT